MDETLLLLMSLGVVPASDIVEDTALLIADGTLSRSDFTEETMLETTLLALVGIASTSDATEERTLLAAEGASPMSEATDDTMLAIAEVTSSISEAIDEMGSRSDGDGAVVVSGTFVLEVTSEVRVTPAPVAVGASVSLLSVASVRECELIGPPDVGSVVS